MRQRAASSAIGIASKVASASSGAPGPGMAMVAVVIASSMKLTPDPSHARTKAGSIEPHQVLRCIGQLPATNGSIVLKYQAGKTYRPVASRYGTGFRARLVVV